VCQGPVRCLLTHRPPSVSAHHMEVAPLP
jgi:hypothetical protein